jgi:hypothetical protein
MSIPQRLVFGRNWQLLLNNGESLDHLNTLSRLEIEERANKIRRQINNPEWEEGELDICKSILERVKIITCQRGDCGISYETGSGRHCIKCYAPLAVEDIKGNTHPLKRCNLSLTLI